MKKDWKVPQKGIFETAYGVMSQKYLIIKLHYAVIWQEQVVLVVGAASSRDHFISRLEAAPTGFFYGNLDFLDKRLVLNLVKIKSMKT